MKPSNKALTQDPTNRGYMNGDRNYPGNHTNEVTWNVALGTSRMGYYTRGGLLKFATHADAMEYIAEVGATEGISYDGNGQPAGEYYTVCKQDGCCFSVIKSYSIK